MTDPVKLQCETVTIEGNRKLYSYTFEIEDAPEPAETEPTGNLKPDMPETSE